MSSIRNQIGTVPANLLAIVVSAGIAIGGYVLFSTRYGKPIREANAAAAKVSAVYGSIPGHVEAAVRERLKSVEQVEQRVESLQKERTSLDANAAQRIARLESEVAMLRGLIQSSGVQARGYPLPTAPAVAPAPASGSLAGPAPSGDATMSNTGTANAAPPTDPIAAETPVYVDAGSGLRIDLQSARVTDGELVLEVTILKYTPGDGYYSIRGGQGDDTKAVTADGAELRRFVAQRPDARYGSSVSGELISGTPIRLLLTFKGDPPQLPFLCRRAQFVVYTDDQRGSSFTARLENFLVQ